MVDDIIVTCVVCIVPVYEGRTYIYNPFCENVKQHPCSGQPVGSRWSRSGDVAVRCYFTGATTNMGTASPQHDWPHA